MDELSAPEQRPAARPVEFFSILRVAVALLLLAAAGMKIHQFSTEPPPSQAFFDQKWVNLLASFYEMALAAWLLSGWARRLAWLVALLTFATFCVYTTHRLAIGADSCGCFGRLKVRPKYTLILDASLFLLLIFIRPRNAPWSPWGQWRRFAIAWACVLPVMAASAVPVLRFKPVTLPPTGDVKVEEGATIVLEPETWIGQPLPLARYIDIADELKRGDWLAAIVHDGCLGCRALVPQLADAARAAGPGKVAKVALIFLPPFKEPSELVQKDGLFLTGRLDESHDWFAQTPTVLRLHDGVVTDVVIAQGDDKRKQVLDAGLPTVEAVSGEQALDAAPGSSRTVLFVIRNSEANAMAISGATSESDRLTVEGCPASIPPHSFGLVSVKFTAPDAPAADWSGRVVVQAAGAGRAAIPLTVRANVH
ncbi:MAG: hypothetical protein BIFFINMI_00298 [Phycisphaerae bacterium]|nr:hypothetical protein [Phycisphaerae bacterium]